MPTYTVTTATNRFTPRQKTRIQIYTASSYTRIELYTFEIQY